jgi:subtilisin family serine protease
MIRFLLILLVATTVAAQATENPAFERAAREVIVKWRSSPLALDAATLIPDLSSEVSAVRMALPAVAARAVGGIDRITVLTAISVQAAGNLVEELRRDSRVEYAELRPVRFTDDQPRGRTTLDGVPDDPYYSQQWGMPLIQAEAAWNITRGDPSVAIAVVDLGVDFDHPELTAERWVNETELHGTAGVDDDHNGFVDDIYGYDFMDGDGDPTPNPLAPPESHGTHVSGLAAATRNNGRGIAGLAPDCKIMGVRVGASSEEGGSILYGYEGIYYACRAGARVINCSWGGSSPSAYERDVLNYVIAQGCVVVASAGNSARIEPNFPAGTEGVISVAASGIADAAATFTNFGPWIKISAPGVFMISTVIGANGVPAYDNYQGTSMSAPLVAAACALVASRFPTMSGAAIAERVVSSADPIDAVNPNKAGMLGIGRLNVWRALADSVGGVHLGAVTYHELSGNQDGRIRAGETASLTIPIFNDLTNLRGVLGRVTQLSGGVTLTNPTCLYGDIGIGGPFPNTTQITLEVPSSMLRGPTVDLSIDWLGEAGQLIGRATTTVYLDSTVVNLDNGNLSLGVSENGCLGYGDYVSNRYIGSGLRLSDHQNALYHGSFVLAADGSVSDNAYNNMSIAGQPDHFDFSAMPDSVAYITPSVRADFEAHASFTDALAEHELLAEVQSAVLGWQNAPHNSYFILEYQVTNRSINPWNMAYAGMFLDWDLGPASTNIGGYDSLAGIAYFRQTMPGYPLVGMASITDSWGSLHVLENRDVLDSRNTWNDSTKWQLLTSGIQSNIPSDARDISLLIAAGPFALEGRQQRTFAYAMLVGDSPEALRALADSARHHYALPAKSLPSSDVQVAAKRPTLYPNPLPAGETLRLSIPVAERARIIFYNVLGQSVAELSDVRAGLIHPNVLGGASGLLFYRIDTSSAHASGKLLILR